MAGAFRWDGRVNSLVYDGGTDVPTFMAFVTTQLVQLLNPGDVVIWDNLPAHKSAQVIEAVQQAGASVALLPSYSPDFNPTKPSGPR